MLSLTAAPLSFAGPSTVAPLGRAAGVRMVEPPPIFSEVDEDVRGYYRTPSESTEAFNPNQFVQTLPGITAPLGFWDPAGFCSSNNGADGSATEGKVRFYREVEVKHARVAMLAALGFPLAEQWHPLFATDDAPSFSAFQLTPLQTFWPAVVFVIAVIEIFSIFTFQSPAGNE